MALQISSISRDNPRWLYLTTERYRIDEHTIDALLLLQLAQTREKGEKTNVYTLLSRCDAWICNTLFNRRSSAPLRITKHLLERAREYQGKLSRCETYVELFPDERELIERLPQTLSATSRYKIVELGFNGDGNVCKIALLLPFCQWLGKGAGEGGEGREGEGGEGEKGGEKRKKRKLFLLVGCDGGLKTFYAVPDIKWRSQYQMDSQITALSLESLTALQTTIEKEKAEGKREAEEKRKKEEEEKGKKEEENDGWTIVKKRK